MSSTAAPMLRICRLHHNDEEAKTYFCLAEESCCKTGCCSTYYYKYFQTWYFWYYFRYILIGIVAAFLVYRYICYKCRSDDHGVRLYRDEPTYNEMANALNPQYINHLIVSYTSLDNLPPLPLHVKATGDGGVEPPPKYSVAVNLPKPPDNGNCDGCTSNSSNNNQIPTYEEALVIAANSERGNIA